MVNMTVQSHDARKALVLLVDALALLESPRSWTRKGYALDGRGRQVAVDDPRARRFCTVGAVLRAEHERAAAPMPVATDPRPEIEDLYLPVAPGAPPHVSLAIRMLGFAVLERFRLTVKQQGETPLSLAHLPMLVGLRRDTGHATAITLLLRAIALLADLELSMLDRPEEAHPE
jgi:hypothetical protein